MNENKRMCRFSFLILCNSYFNCGNLMEKNNCKYIEYINSLINNLSIKYVFASTFSFNKSIIYYSIFFPNNFFENGTLVNKYELFRGKTWQTLNNTE